MTRPPRPRLTAILTAALLLAGCAPAGAPSPEQTPSATASAGPAEALDVTHFPSAGFTAVSGRIWCDMSSRGVFCLVPRGYQGTSPTQKEPCPSWESEGALHPNTVILDGAKPRWKCLGDQAASPYKDDSSTEWQRGFGRWQVIDGSPMAVLPVGKRLVRGPYECLVTADAVECANGRTSHAVKLTVKQVTLS